MASATFKSAVGIRDKFLLFLFSFYCYHLKVRYSTLWSYSIRTFYISSFSLLGDEALRS